MGDSGVVSEDPTAPDMGARRAATRQVRRNSSCFDVGPQGRPSLPWWSGEADHRVSKNEPEVSGNFGPLVTELGRDIVREWISEP